MNVTLARLLACLALTGLLAAYRRPAPPDLSSPTATVRSFATALNTQDPAALIACVSGGQDTPEMEANLKNLLSGAKFVIVNPVAKIKGDQACVTMDIQTDPKTAQKILLHDALEVKKEGAIWKIIPDQAMIKMMKENHAPKLAKMSAVNFLAVVAGGSEEIKQVFRGAVNKAKEASCLNNGKQMALASVMYVQDYDERFPRKSDSYKKVIYPYIKNEAVFTCPLDPKGTLSYSYNTSLQGVSLAAITKPAITIVYYEGKARKPLYRHNGKAMISFADGHAKLCSPQEVKKFIWTEADWK